MSIPVDTDSADPAEPDCGRQSQSPTSHEQPSLTSVRPLKGSGRQSWSVPERDGPDASGTKAGRQWVKLRPYQEAACAAVDREWWLHKSTLLHLATGLGKTVIAANVIRAQVRAGHRALFLVHRTELADQSLGKLRAAGVLAALELGASRARLADLAVVASVQSLQGDRLARFPVDHFGVVVVDEAHHAVAKQYRAILDHFANAKLLGLSATPFRADGRPLDRLFRTVAFRMDLRDGIAAGYLASLIARRVWVDGLDLRSVAKVGGDFHAGQLDAAMRSARTALVGPLSRLIGSRKTIVFSVSVLHAMEIASDLRRHGIAAVAIDGSASREHRREVLTGFHRGDFQVLVNCALFTEGFDEPSIECVAVCRPTMSVGLLLQMVGRGLRLHPGKVDCLWLDFVGASKHSLASAADVMLAGDPHLETMREEIERLVDVAPHSLMQVIEQVREQTQERLTAQDVLVVSAYRATEVDPFLSVTSSYLPGLEPARGGALEPETIKFLAKELGIIHPPAGLSNSEAMRWVTASRARKAAGFCSVKVARRLARYGLDSRRMSGARAAELIARLRHFAWKPYCVATEPEMQR